MSLTQLADTDPTSTNPPRNPTISRKAAPPNTPGTGSGRSIRSQTAPGSWATGDGRLLAAAGKLPLAGSVPMGSDTVGPGMKSDAAVSPTAIPATTPIAP